MRKALASVPSPGFCRNGIQASRTSTEVPTTIVPKVSGTCCWMPTWSTSQGISPSTLRTTSAIEAP